MNGLERTKFILEKLEKVAVFLEADNFTFGTGGSMFSTDWITLENTEKSDKGFYLYWLVGTQRQYEKQQAVYLGGSWLRHIGDETTPEFNKIIAGWIRELEPRIEKIHARYFQMQSKKK